MKVLIIEKDETVRQSLSYFIEHQRNFEVFSVNSKEEGVSLFTTIPFDIVLCGDHLPDGDGLEILKEWAKKDPNLVSVLLTVHGDELLRQEAIKAGIRGFLVKPFELKQLEEIMSISDCGLRKAE